MMLWGKCTLDPWHRWGEREEFKFNSPLAAYTEAKNMGK